MIKYSPYTIKAHILAFDKHYDEKGEWIRERTSFYVPNDYVVNLAKQYPGYFNPTISIHPYRKDALIELEKWGETGIKYLKWLPSAMGIDPSHQKIIPFYKMMKKYDMVLLAHTGEEKAVDGEEFQHFGNPLLFKKALDMGVKVIMAHVASLGQCEDIDNKGQTKSCFDLFWRLFNDPKYKNNLYADISGITMYTRVGTPTTKLLEHPELHHRLVNGSDYPLPAINWLYRTKQLLDLGYINEKEKTILNEIYDYNPYLFDFVLKRIIKHPVTGQQFKPETFMVPKSLGCDQ